jgi:hypothetical protein
MEHLFDTNHTNKMDDLMQYRREFDAIARLNGIERQEQWYTQIYSVDYKRLHLSLFGGHVTKAVEAVYPEFTWYQWLFPTVPLQFWNDLSNQVHK